jgi:hypothetical protein
MGQYRSIAALSTCKMADEIMKMKQKPISENHLSPRYRPKHKFPYERPKDQATLIQANPERGGTLHWGE